MAHPLSVEDLLASGATTHTVALPAALLAGAPEGDGAAAESPAAGEVVLRPLLVRDVDRVVRAAREQRVLTSVLLVQQALVAPKMTVEQVGSLPAGLVQFLAGKVKAPLARACFVLAREFGWTPAECSELTVGQILLYLEMLARDEHAGNAQGGAAA